MSTVFDNHVTVTGPRDDVRRLRDAARRRIPAHLVEQFSARQVPWSFEKLLRRHPELGSRFGEPPRDDWHYWADASRVARWGDHWRFQFFLEVKNFQIHEMLRPLSGIYPTLCFVAAELCLDDGSITSRFIHRRRTSTWELPESRHDAHWLAAARELGIPNLEEAYEDDAVRSEVESRMFEEGLSHWEERVRKVLHTQQPVRE